MEFTFTILEECTYSQQGTVTVEADTEEEAIALAEEGKYEHAGDNEIMLDTEVVLNRTATLI